MLSHPPVATAMADCRASPMAGIHCKGPAIVEATSWDVVQQLVIVIVPQIPSRVAQDGRHQVTHTTTASRAARLGRSSYSSLPTPPDGSTPSSCGAGHPPHVPGRRETKLFWLASEPQFNPGSPPRHPISSPPDPPLYNYPVGCL